MTLHRDEPKTEVGVRELRDQLSRHRRHVGSGGDVIVTMRGREPLTADGSVSDLVSEQRR